MTDHAGIARRRLRDATTALHRAAHRLDQHLTATVEALIDGEDPLPAKPADVLGYTSAMDFWRAAFEIAEDHLDDGEIEAIIADTSRRYVERLGR